MIRLSQKFGLLGAILAAIAGPIAAPLPAIAQDWGIDGDAYVPGEPLPGVCMVRSSETAGADVVTTPTREIVAVVADIESLQSKGYAIAPCPATLGNHALVEQWRDRVCAAASLADEQQQTRFEEEWGERAALLCGSVERVVGPWAGPTDISGADDQ